MTNVQKWIFAVLVLFIALFVLAKLTENDESGFVEENEYYEESAQQEDQSGDVSEIQNLLTVNSCYNCHGTDLKGTTLGPSLYTASEYWNRSGLINYLRNPSSYSGNERFESYKEEYNHIVMPSYENVNVKDLGRMADYILSLEE